jgi:hypothetical protein
MCYARMDFTRRVAGVTEKQCFGSLSVVPWFLKIIGECQCCTNAAHTLPLGYDKKMGRDVACAVTAIPHNQTGPERR